ncbi:peptidyl-prolyl cis-trans isomerase FKBP8-like [Lampetra fluviatilis]
MEAALRSCSAALLLQPHSARALLRRGMVMALLGRHEEAAASLSSALELEPTNVVIHSELFKLRRRMSLRARDGKFRDRKTATGKKPWTLVPWRWLLGAVALALGAAVVTSIARL